MTSSLIADICEGAAPRHVMPPPGERRLACAAARWDAPEARHASVAGLHFTTGHLEEMGHAVCQTLLDYISPDNTFASDVLRELDVMARSGGGMVDSLVDEDDPPTDSEDDEDEDEDGKGKGAEAEAVPAPAGADSKVKRSAGKKRGGKGRAMRELEMLSKQGEAASQLLMQDALQFFQNRCAAGAS